MASGIEMMMKAMGLDPMEIREQMERPINELMAAIKVLKERLDSIDAALDVILEDRNLERPKKSNMEILVPERKAG